MKKATLVVVAALIFLGLPAGGAVEYSARTLRIIDPVTQEPIVGAAIASKGWNHSTLIIIRGRYIDPRCCSIARRTMMKSDTAGMVVIPAEAMKRDFTVVEITPPHRPMVQLLFRAGRPASLLTDQKEYSGRDFDALLGPGGRDTSPLNIIIPAKNP